MDHLEEDYPERLLAPRVPPCLSLYQPTHPARPDKLQDPIRFRNLVRSLEALLAQRYAVRDAAPVLAPLRALAEDHGFWNHVEHGLAVLRSRDEFRVYRLQRSVPELALVADSFHTKPLLRIQQSADRYQILALRRDRVELYEGNRDALARIDLAPQVPATAADELGENGIERQRANRVYGSAKPAAVTRHGTDVSEDMRDNETERYFRAVDRAVAEFHSRPTRLPLLLAALPEHHHLFRRVSQNPFLLDMAIDVHPDDLSLEDLRQRAWQAVLPKYLARLTGLIAAFQAAQAKHEGSADVSDVARAAFEGRVATLLVDADRHIHGRIETPTGAIALAKAGATDAGDLLDDIGEQVLRTRGEVVVVPSERMPVQGGVAAIYRY